MQTDDPAPPPAHAVFDINAIASNFPASASTMLIDTRLTDEPEASSRVFRIYSPPYFYDSDGNPAVRPTITGVPLRDDVGIDDDERVHDHGDSAGQLSLDDPGDERNAYPHRQRDARRQRRLLDLGDAGQSHHHARRRRDVHGDDYGRIRVLGNRESVRERSAGARDQDVQPGVDRECRNIRADR